MKTRADQLLVKRGLADTRSSAQALILAGEVFTARGRVEKSGQLIDETEILEVKERLPFVSRGGLKLEPALKELGVDPKDLVCLDVGASTGGFTDCLLQKGAKRVYAVDVGYGQFHAKLRSDPRVVLHEKTNFRTADPGLFPEKADLAVVDVSFISLAKILPNLKRALKEGGAAVALVKPQFELGPKDAKKGVVRSEALREKAVADAAAAAEDLGFCVLGKAWSTVPGPKGNRECFLHLRLS